MKEEVYFEGLVLHSQDIERLRNFYESLLGTQFKEEQHEKGDRHYACRHHGVLLELYPSKNVCRSPHLIFEVEGLDSVVERMKDSFKEKFDQPHYKGAKLQDPDGRTIVLYENRKK